MYCSDQQMRLIRFFSLFNAKSRYGRLATAKSLDSSLWSFKQESESKILNNFWVGAEYIQPKQEHCRSQKFQTTEIFDSDSTPALAEYTPTPKDKSFGLWLLLKLQSECYKLLGVSKRPYPVFALTRLKNRIKRNRWTLQDMWLLLCMSVASQIKGLKWLFIFCNPIPYILTVKLNRKS